MADDKQTQQNKPTPFATRVEQSKNQPKVVNTQPEVNPPAPATTALPQPHEAPTTESKPKSDFVKLVKEAVPSMGMSTFTRVNLKNHVTDQGLEDLNKEYASQGYEVFSNGKSVLLLKS